jgi:hypothetical protein
MTGQFESTMTGDARPIGNYAATVRIQPGLTSNSPRYAERPRDDREPV